MTKNIIIGVLFIYSTILSVDILTGDAEYISTQTYRVDTLQYLEDIRNELEVMNETRYEDYILNK